MSGQLQPQRQEVVRHGSSIHFLHDNKTIMVGSCCTVVNITIDKKALERMKRGEGGSRSLMSFNWSDLKLDESVITRVIKLNVIDPFDSFYHDVCDGFVRGENVLTREFVDELHKLYRTRLLNIRDGCIAFEVGFSDEASFYQFQENKEDVFKLCENFLAKCCKRSIPLSITVLDEDVSMDVGFSMPMRQETEYTYRELEGEESLKDEFKKEQRKTVQKLKDLFDYGMAQPPDSQEKVSQTKEAPPSYLQLSGALPPTIAVAARVQRDDQPSPEDVRKHRETSKLSEPSTGRYDYSGFPTSEILQPEQHGAPRELPIDLTQEQSQFTQEMLHVKPNEEQSTSPVVDETSQPDQQTLPGRSQHGTEEISAEDAELYEFDSSEGNQKPIAEDRKKAAESVTHSEPPSLYDSGLPPSGTLQTEHHETPREYPIDMRGGSRFTRKDLREKPNDQQSTITDVKTTPHPNQSSEVQSTGEDVPPKAGETTTLSEPSTEDVHDSGLPTSETSQPEHHRKPREFTFDLRPAQRRRREEELSSTLTAKHSREVQSGQIGPQSTEQQQRLHDQYEDEDAELFDLLSQDPGTDVTEKADKSVTDAIQTKTQVDVSDIENLSLSTSTLEQATGVDTSERTVAPSDLGKVVERPKLPALGTRVTRGADWKYGSQDGDGPGTIYAHDQHKNYVWVLWDCGAHNCYRYNRKKAFDVQVVQDRPRRPLSRHSFELGVIVRTADPSTPVSGTPHTGTGVVIRRSDTGTVMVRWSNREITSHVPEQGSIRDIAICDDVIPESGLMDVSQRIPTAQDITRSPQPVKEGTKHIWRWRDKGDNWHCYPQQLQETFEKQFQKKPPVSFLIRKSKKSFRIHISSSSMEEEDVTTKERLLVERKAVAAEEYAALLSGE